MKDINKAIEDCDKEIEILKKTLKDKQLEKNNLILKRDNGVWIPQDGEHYYITTPDNKVNEITWGINEKTDEDLYNAGNVIQTLEEATLIAYEERLRRKLIAYKKKNDISDEKLFRTEGYEPYVWIISYDKDNKCYKAKAHQYNDFLSIYFNSQTVCWKAINTFKEDLIYYAMLKENLNDKKNNNGDE